MFIVFNFCRYGIGSRHIFGDVDRLQTYLRLTPEVYRDFCSIYHVVYDRFLSKDQALDYLNLRVTNRYLEFVVPKWVVFVYDRFGIHSSNKFATKESLRTCIMNLCWCTDEDGYDVFDVSSGDFLTFKEIEDIINTDEPVIAWQKEGF